MEQSSRRQYEGNAVYRIPEHNMDGLNARITKMNRRAAKLGMEPLLLSEVGEEFDLYRQSEEMSAREWRFVERAEGETIADAMDRIDASKGKHFNQIYKTCRYVLVTVVGTLPRCNGWAMAATIQHDPAGNLLMTVPGWETLLPMRYRTASPACEHCDQDRKRKDTYVLQSETDGWKQVGRNCLADFIRATNAAAWAEAAEMLAGLDAEMGEYEDDGYGFGGGRGTITFRAVDLLTQVACIVRQDGWCSRTEAKNSMDGKQATVDFALCLFDSKYRAKLSEKDQDRLVPSADDKSKAEKAIEWAQGLPADVGNDYLWNVRVVSHRESISHREAGLAGSIVAAYLRHLEQELKRAYERQNALNEHFGEVGKRDIFTLTVMAERDMESQYGSLTLYKFRDADGRTAAWFASNGASLDIGSTYRIKATVKKHNDYQGMKQTMLSRADVLLNLTAIEDYCMQGEHFINHSGSPEYCTVCGEFLGAANEGQPEQELAPGVTAWSTGGIL